MFFAKCNFKDGSFETPRIPENRGNVDPMTGYRNINLRLKTGGRKAFKLHRAVYMAKYGAIPEKMHVMHLDGNQDNCSLDNLRAGSASENNLMKTNFGKSSFGTEPVPVFALHNETQTKFDSINQAAISLGIHGSTIGKILDTREKNKYYKNTYTKSGKKFTFIKC